MKIVVIGTGYVGLVSGTCFAELGAAVTCLDIDKNKIDALKKGGIPIFEPNLDKLVIKNHKAGRLGFSTDVEKYLKTADIVFIAVGTPSGKDGSADLTYIYSAAKTIAKNAKSGIIVVTKSTVPVGTNQKIYNLIKKTNPKLKFEVASNPEFLREGAAVQDFLKPDRVVIGCQNSKTFEKIASLYRPIKNVKILHTDIATAEMIKYAANAYLAMRVSFVNEVSDICEKLGADIDKVSEGLGLDNRIGNKFLKVGPGFGGSCFPKDTKAFQKIAIDAGAPTKIISAVIEANDARKINMAKKIIKAAGGNVKGKNIGVLGIAFKANTDDIRDSSALVIIEELLKAGANIFTYDPEAAQNAKKCFKGNKNLKNINFCKSKDEVLKNCKVISIITEWEEFKNLKSSQLKGKTLVDLRNLYKAENFKGVKYISLGRK